MRWAILLPACACILFPPGTGYAQFSADQGIQGTGSKVLEQPAERLRLQIDLLAKSKDLPDALKKLAARKAKAAKQLETLGALKDTIKFGEPRVDESQDQNQQQRMMMMRQRMASRRPGKKPPAEPAQPLKVALQLTAEWPLKPGDGASQLLDARKLQDAIKAADLAGLKESEELTPEEAEEAEEADEEMGMMYSGQNGPKPGEPAFLFTARIPDADREKALAEAFRNARTEATQLAKAAGIELGSLRSLQANMSIDTEDNDEYQQLYRSSFSRMLRGQLQGTEKPSEAIGTSPGMLKYRVTVVAAFSIGAGPSGGK
jgi:uncharacterized protein YggE